MSSANSNEPKVGYLGAAEELKTNARQWEAYESVGNCVVLAGPGSGKTKVLTTKLARMLDEDVSMPRGIVCMTFSSECARELTRRLGKLGVRGGRNLFVGTVHSFCLTQVVLPYAHLAGIPIPDPLSVAPNAVKQDAFAKALAAAVSADEDPARWRTRCDVYRRTILDRQSPDWHERDADAAKVVEQYEKLLRQQGFIDFDDMMLIGLQLVEAFPWVRKAIRARYPVIVVDEYQDLGVPLHRIVLSLCFREGENNSRLLAVGDPDQSIYGFAGAQPELLRDVAEREDVQDIQLELNYRSRSRLVEGGEAALGEQRGYKSASGDGGVIDFHKCPDGLAHQAESICKELIPAVLESGEASCLGEIAVLYSTRNIGDEIASAASDAGFPYIRVDQGAAYPKTPLTRWLEDCAAWCAGGWETSEPPLSGILFQWQSFNTRLATPSERQHSRRQLVRFLFDHRDGTIPIAKWLGGFKTACLLEMLQDEPATTDNRDVFERLENVSAGDGELAPWTVATFGGQGGSPDHLNLLTLHSSKGLEFDVVFILGMDEGREPPFWIKAEAGIAERRRLFFVGFTRARNEVHLMFSGWIQTKNGRWEKGPSRFLVELSKRLEGQKDETS